jgi:hypothetical protein
MKTDLDKLNERASESFEKAKKKLGFASQVIDTVSNKKINVDVEKIQKVANARKEVIINPETQDKYVKAIDEFQNELSNKLTDSEMNRCDAVLNFLEQVNISNDLKLAISHIVASEDKDKISNLQKAISYINKELE